MGTQPATFYFQIGTQSGNELHVKPEGLKRKGGREFNTAFCCLLGRAVERFPVSVLAAEKTVPF